jgi:ADP-heptose:LPS heptosyltransferase
VGEADGEIAAAVERDVGHALPRWEQLPLVDLARSLAGCRAYLGNDSGISHLAGLAGARVIVIFGPSSPVQWKPLGPAVQVEPFGAEPARVAALLCTMQQYA